MAIAVCAVDGVAGLSDAALSPTARGFAARVTEISDLGFTGGLGLVVFPVFTAGGADFFASTGVWEAGVCSPGPDGLAAGLDLGRGWGLLTVCAFGAAAFLSVRSRIFLRTTFGVAGSLAGWSHPSRTIKKQIKQAKLQMIIKFFFMMFQLIFEKDVNLLVRFLHHFFFFFFFFFGGAGSTNL